MISKRKPPFDQDLGSTLESNDRILLSECRGSYFLARKSRPSAFHLSECLSLRVQ